MLWNAFLEMNRRTCCRPPWAWQQDGLAIGKPLFVLFVLALVAGLPRAGADYTFTPIDVPSATMTYAQGLNNDGLIVGAYEDGSGRTLGFFLSGNAFTAIAVPGLPFAEINHADKGGVAVGDYGDPDGDGSLHGSGGIRTDFDVPGAMATTPVSINIAGTISGYYSGPDQSSHGFLRAGDTYTTLDFPGAGVTDTLAYGSNDAGQIVGVYFDDSGVHGFLKNNDTYTAIDVPNADRTVATDINSQGDIVGFYGVGAARHAYVLSGGMFTVLDFPGVSVTRAYGINDHGAIAGWYVDANGAAHGFLATPVP